jgi:hypothetical protein
VYVTGNVRLDGSVNTSSNNPKNLQVHAVTSGTTFEMSSQNMTYADIYAPGTAFRMRGGSKLAGSVVAKSVAWRATPKSTLTSR